MYVHNRQKWCHERQHASSNHRLGIYLLLTCFASGVQDLFCKDSAGYTSKTFCLLKTSSELFWIWPVHHLLLNSEQSLDLHVTLCTKAKISNCTKMDHWHATKKSFFSSFRLAGDIQLNPGPHTLGLLHSQNGICSTRHYDFGLGLLDQLLGAGRWSGAPAAELMSHPWDERIRPVLGDPITLNTSGVQTAGSILGDLG